MYIMKKLNREKRAATEERRKELESQGYVCIGVMEKADRKNNRTKETKAGKPEKEEKSREADPDGTGTGKNDGGTDDTGKN